MLANLAYNSTTKQRSEDRANDPRLLSDQDLHIAAMPGGARQFFNLDLTLTRKFFELASHANASLSDHVFAPSNGILAAVYDSIGPAIVAHERQ
jgi:hypothetical protein